MRRLLAWIPRSIALLVALSGASCSGTTGTDSVAPVTGISVRAETVTAGKGCGRAPTQVFKYVTFVLGLDAKNEFTEQLASSITDCFADAIFTELPARNGRTEYGVLVYAFNEAAWTAAGGDAGVRERARTYSSFASANPTWSTRCDAAQSDLVVSLARCDALVPAATAPASVDLSLASFARAEAGALQCDVDFATVVYRYAVDGAAPGATAETPCSKPGSLATTRDPVTVTISPAAAPASYAFEVALVRADGAPVGQTRCTATTSPGLKSSAACQPVK